MCVCVCVCACACACACMCVRVCMRGWVGVFLSLLLHSSIPKCNTNYFSLQTFDLRTENSEEAHWSLLLSHLPLLYPHTSQDHLTAMAADITTALHSTEGTLSSLDGLSVGRVVREFLNSDAFLEMATLQELLLTSALSQVQVAATAT